MVERRLAACDGLCGGKACLVIGVILRQEKIGFGQILGELNGLQQELIQYNGKFAEPINEMNQRIVALQRMDVHSLQREGIWDSSSALFEPMMRNVV